MLVYQRVYNLYSFIMTFRRNVTGMVGNGQNSLRTNKCRPGGDPPLRRLLRLSGLRSAGDDFVWSLPVAELRPLRPLRSLALRYMERETGVRSQGKMG